MIRKILTASVASAALAIAAPAVAGPGHGKGGPGGGLTAGGGANAGAHANANAGSQMNSGQGAMHANVNSALSSKVTTNTDLNTNPAIGISQGPNHASINGIANANSHSVLAAGSMPSGSLSGLTTGLNVQNSSGTMVGQISQIVTDRSGNIRLVLVTDSTTGQTFRVAPNTLTVNGTVVTTSANLGG